MSENLRAPLCPPWCSHDSNIRDLSHMTAISPHIECLKERGILNGRDISASSIDTARTVGFHLANRPSTARWNERDALCI